MSGINVPVSTHGRHKHNKGLICKPKKKSVRRKRDIDPIGNESSSLSAAFPSDRSPHSASSCLKNRLRGSMDISASVTRSHSRKSGFLGTESNNESRDRKLRSLAPTDRLQKQASSYYDRIRSQLEESSLPCSNNDSEADAFSIQSRRRNSSKKDKAFSRYSWTHPNDGNNVPTRAQLYSDMTEQSPRQSCINNESHGSSPIAVSNILIDQRPPSRQKHAFPTHLIDANAFGSRKNIKQGQRISARSMSYRPTEPATSVSDNNNEEHEEVTARPAPDIHKRPPSRYMTKAKQYSKDNDVVTELPHRGTASSESNNNSSEQSRRYVGNTFLWSPAHHDPKTDGFAEVDESIPPPFRIEIITDTDYEGLNQQSTSKTSLYTSPDTRTGDVSILSRPWTCFENQSQADQLADNDTTEAKRAVTDPTSSTTNLSTQWFDKVESQIADADLFETVLSVSSPRLSDGEKTLDERNNLRTPSFSKVSCTNTGNHRPLIHSSNDEYCRVQTSDLCDMDPDTALAQTPLYTCTDLMATRTSEFSNETPDDNVPGNLSPLPTSPLHTSLGKDFLSLFAQH